MVILTILMFVNGMGWTGERAGGVLPETVRCLEIHSVTVAVFIHWVLMMKWSRWKATGKKRAGLGVGPAMSTA